MRLGYAASFVEISNYFFLFYSFTGLDLPEAAPSACGFRRVASEVAALGD